MKKVLKIKRIVGVLMLLLVVFMGVYVVTIFLPNKNKGIDIVIEETIKFDYSTYKRDSKLYKNIFEQLKKELNKTEIDYEKYDEYISKLFVIDLYTLDNKISKNDIGGVQFLKDEQKENFTLNMSNTMYKYVENNVNGDRKQELPIVEEVELISIEKSEYKIKDKTYESYVVNLNWKYKKDLGYEDNGSFVLIKDGDELFVVEKSEVDE